MKTYEEFRTEASECLPVQRVSDFARIADEAEFVKGLTKISMINNGGPPGIVLHCSDDNTAYVQTDTVHTLISGTTGSGKSVSVIGSTLEYWSKTGCPVVISDPKGELMDLTAKKFEENSYCVKVLDLRNPMRGIRYNPLSEICKQLRSENSEIREEGESELSDIFHRLIMGDTEGLGTDSLYWTEAPWHFLCGLTKEMLHRLGDNEEVTIPMIKTAADMIVTDGEIMLRFRKTLGENNPNEPELASMLSIASDNTRSGMTGNIHRGLSFAGSSAMTDLLSGNDIDIHEMSSGKPVVLYVISPDNTDIYDTFVSMVLGQIIHILYNDADRLYGGSLPKEVLFMLDEFANIPQITSFEKIITTARSRRIRFVLAVQSVSQLTSRYGAAAETIISNCRDWICTAGNSAFCKLLDDNIGLDQSGKNIFTVNALRCLTPGHPLVIHGTSNPFISNYPMIQNTEDKFVPELRKKNKIFSIQHIREILRINIEWKTNDISPNEPQDVSDTTSDNDCSDYVPPDFFENEDELNIVSLSKTIVSIFDFEKTIISDTEQLAGVIALLLIANGTYSGQEITVENMMRIQSMIEPKPPIGKLIRTLSFIVTKDYSLYHARRKLRLLGISPGTISNDELDNLIVQLRKDLWFLEGYDLN